jgi:zinc protease
MPRAFLIGFLLAAHLAAPPGARALGPEVTEHSLGNGLKVLLAEDHSSPLVIFQVWYRVGGMDEVSGRSGLSHLLEHMMFKGTETYGSKVLSRTVRLNGGIDNAFTSKDFTAYFQIMPSDRVDISLKFESDRMKNLLLKNNAVLAERDVVMEERRLRYVDNPKNTLFEQVAASAFTVHPYRRPVIGWMEDLAQIEHEDLLEHYRAYYSPDNAVIVAVGDFETGEMIEKISSRFGGLKPLPRGRSHVSAEPAQAGGRRVTLRKKEARLPYVLMAYHAPPFPHVDAFALEVLAEALSGGKSSRLHKSLVRGKRLALSAFAEYAGMSRDPYLFFLGGTAAAGKEARELEKALLEEAAAIAGAPITERELEKAKNAIEASFIMDMDSIYMQAMIIGTSEMIGDWRLRD